MSFNLVLDEPVESDKVEEHEGLNFIVEDKIYDEFGPFTLVSKKQGTDVYLEITPAKQPEQGGGCTACPSCG